MKLEEFNIEDNCEETYSGEHEWIFKWELPDRECRVCKKCGKEVIRFND